MKKYFAQLRPMERRLVVGVAVILVIVLNWWFIWPHFSDWNDLRRRNDEAPEGVARRDRIDSTRAASPLREAADAHRLDTTGRAVQDVVEEVLSWL